MPGLGFGSGPFGTEPFGEAAWSRRVLFESLPQEYRLRDATEGGSLEAFLEALRGPLEDLRRRIRDFGDLRDPLLARTQFDEAVRVRLGARVVPVLAAEQRGVDGVVDVTRAFLSATARFRPEDRGKELTLRESAIPGNNRTARVAAVLSATSVLTEPPFAIDAGPLRWELRPTLEMTSDRITLELRSADVGDIRPGFVLSDGFAEFQILSRRRFGKRFFERRLLTEREGADGSIDGFGRLVAPSALFTQRDVGRTVSITRALEADNNDLFEIVSVISPSVAVLHVALIEEVGSFHWALFPFPEIEILGPGLPRGVVEQEGVDLEGVAPSTFKSASARFTATDVGKRLTVRGSGTIPSNDGIYEVASVVSASEVTVTSTAVQTEAAILTWELRSGTLLGDLTQVDVRATSLLAFLAQDFGITIDSQESEERQRSFIYHALRWMDQKGHENAYQILGTISGFDVVVSHLFRIGQDLASGLPSANIFEVGEAAAGRSGVDGSLVAGTGGRVRFTAPTALFTAIDVGSHIRISGTPSDPNDKLYTIDVFLDAQTVEFRFLDTATVPDARNPNLVWRIVRLYTDQPPLLPLYDEVNIDALVAEVGSAAFTVDKYCWEPGFSTAVSLTILGGGDAPFLLETDRYRVRVTGAADVVAAVGKWKITDSAARSYFLETVPVVFGGGFEFEVVGSVAPTVGAATLEYVCAPQATCDYCGSNRVLARISAGSIALESGVAVERVLERVIERLQTEVKPAHVVLVPVFTQSMTATISIGVTVEPTLT